MFCQRVNMMLGRTAAAAALDRTKGIKSAGEAERIKYIYQLDQKHLHVSSSHAWSLGVYTLSSLYYHNTAVLLKRNHKATAMCCGPLKHEPQPGACEHHKMQQVELDTHTYV